VTYSSPLFRPDSHLPVSPSAPTLIPLDPPPIVLGHQDTLVRMTTTVLRYWDTMGLEPFSGQKDVVSFVLFEQQGSDSFVDRAKQFLQSFGEAFQVCVVCTWCGIFKPS
jgi:hypothetical protein